MSWVTQDKLPIDSSFNSAAHDHLKKHRFVTYHIATIYILAHHFSQSCTQLMVKK